MAKKRTAVKPARAAKKASAPKKRATNRRQARPPNVAEVIGELRALEEPLGLASDPSEDPWPEARKLVRRLVSLGQKPRLVTKCGRHHWSGRSVSAKITRRLFFGEHLYAKWDFDLVGEAASQGTGLWLMRDFEEPPIPNDFLADIGLDPDDFDTFPDEVP